MKCPPIRSMTSIVFFVGSQPAEISGVEPEIVLAHRSGLQLFLVSWRKEAVVAVRWAHSSGRRCGTMSPLEMMLKMLLSPQLFFGCRRRCDCCRSPAASQGSPAGRGPPVSQRCSEETFSFRSGVLDTGGQKVATAAPQQPPIRLDDASSPFCRAAPDSCFKSANTSHRDDEAFVGVAAPVYELLLHSPP